MVRAINEVNIAIIQLYSGGTALIGGWRLVRMIAMDLDRTILRGLIRESAGCGRPCPTEIIQCTILGRIRHFVPTIFGSAST